MILNVIVQVLGTKIVAVEPRDATAFLDYYLSKVLPIGKRRGDPFADERAHIEMLDQSIRKMNLQR